MPNLGRPDAGKPPNIQPQNSNREHGQTASIPLYLLDAFNYALLRNGTVVLAYMLIVMRAFSWVVIQAFVILLMGSSCRYIVSEPLPDFTVRKIQYTELPDAVIAAFRVDWQGVAVMKVEAACFKGKPKQFRIEYVAGNENKYSIYGSDGVRVGPPGLFHSDK